MGRNQAGDHRPYPVDKDGDAALIRVQAIRLVEVGIHRNTLQKKWVELCLMGMRQLGKNLVEGAIVGLAPIRRRQHSQYQHFGAGTP